MLKSGNAFLEKLAALPDYNPVYNAPLMIVISASGGNDAQGMNVANAACAGQNIPLCAILAGYTDDTSPHTERGTGKNVNYVS